MKLALISDIHGNLEALRAVLSDIDKQDVDKIHCLGDIIGYGCNPTECLDLVAQSCDIILLGNHEYVALGLLEESAMNEVARQSTEWTCDHLSDSNLETIANLDLEASVENTYLVHACPYEPDQWHYMLRPEEAVVGFDNFIEQIGFFGHSHVPMIFTLYPQGTCSAKPGHDIDPDPDCRYLVNVGSVGQPRDLDPRSSYVIYDSESRDVRFHRVEYDIGLVQQKMTKANIHSMLVERLLVGR
ncbi:MAG: metallophosphoesterase family protein [Candidatus Zixiibacteriota bacterium]|nr:MAG: metallophosphoesterase family protein [candidate division Zixibacteria bacterium]